MRLVTRVDEGPPIHRVDAHHYAEKIGALRDLIDSRIALTALRFDAHLPGAGENLAGDEKRQNARNDSVPCDIAAHQAIVVTTVTVPGKVGIVLVKPNFVAGRQVLISAPRALREDTLARLVLCNDLVKSCALRRGIFRVRVIVVKPGAV